MVKPLIHEDTQHRDQPKVFIGRRAGLKTVIQSEANYIVCRHSHKRSSKNEFTNKTVIIG